MEMNEFDDEEQQQPPLYEQMNLFPPNVSLLCADSSEDKEDKTKETDQGCVECANGSRFSLFISSIERCLFFINNWTDIFEQNKQIKKELIQTDCPQALRGALWWKLLQVDQFKKDKKFAEDLYFRLLSSSPPFSSLLIISRDANRTFPQHFLFRDQKAAGQQALFKVLRAYATYNPAVGYCQGMGFVCGVLLLHLREEAAFYCFVCLLNKFDLETMYSPGLPLLDEYFFQFQHLLQTHLPKLSAHLASEGVEPSMYLSGEKILFQIPLAILKIYQTALLRSSFEEILSLLKTAPGSLSSSVLIETCLKIKINKSTLAALKEEYLNTCKTKQNTKENADINP